MIQISENKNILDEYMPSVRAVNKFFKSSLKAFLPVEKVPNSYFNSLKSENYSQNIGLEKILKNEALQMENSHYSAEKFYQSDREFSEKEKLIEKTNSQSYLNEYRTRENMVENGAKNVEINIDMTGMQNNISATNDIDEFLSQMTAKLETAMKSTANGVHI